MPTVSVSMIPEVTCAVGPPRVAAIAYPMSRPMGRPGDAAGQREVLRASLRVLADAPRAGTLVELPFVWPETPRQARRGAEVQPPIARLLARKPWLAAWLYAGRIPEEASPGDAPES